MYTVITVNYLSGLSFQIKYAYITFSNYRVATVKDKFHI